MSRLLDVHNFVAEKLKWQEQVLHDHSISATAKVVGCQLMHDLNVGKRGAWRSQPEISALLGIHLRTVRRCMAELVQAGHLVTTPSRGRGHAILYEALICPSEPASKEGNTPPIDAEHRENTSKEKGGKSRTGSEQKGANGARKSARNAPPLLDEPINPPLSPPTPIRPRAATPPSQTARAVPPSARGTGFAVPQFVRSRFPPDFVASYLDGAAWRASDRAIVCRGQTAFTRINRDNRALLKELGVVVVLDPSAHTALMLAAAQERRAA